MTQIQLENDQLSIAIDSFGAELQSIKHKGIEYLWQGDVQFWGRKAPILFPIVGKLRNGQYRYNEQVYDLPGHGFARDSEFELVASDAHSLTYELTASKDTKQHYPWDFRLQVSYTLIKNRIEVAYHVKNTDEKFMYFGIGAHPAFNAPLVSGQFEDYSLTLSGKAALKQIPIDPATGTVDLEQSKVTEEKVFPLTRELFAQDALVFETPGKQEVLLANNLDAHTVKLSWENMPYLGLWSPYPREAPFVCIEPWCGIADENESDQDLTTKLGINELAPGERFKCRYTIEID